MLESKEEANFPLWLPEDNLFDTQDQSRFLLDPIWLHEVELNGHHCIVCSWNRTQWLYNRCHVGIDKGVVFERCDAPCRLI